MSFLQNETSPETSNLFINEIVFKTVLIQVIADGVSLPRHFNYIYDPMSDNDPMSQRSEI